MSVSYILNLEGKKYKFTRFLPLRFIVFNSVKIILGISNGYCNEYHHLTHYYVI